MRRTDRLNLEFSRRINRRAVLLGSLQAAFVGTLAYRMRYLQVEQAGEIKLLAEATFMAAAADEPEDMNFVRKHALAYMAQTGCDLETAALRVLRSSQRISTRWAPKVAKAKASMAATASVM